VESIPVGIRLRVRVPLGFHTGLVDKGAEAVAATLRVREVRVFRDQGDASIAHVTVVRREAFTSQTMVWPWRDAKRSSFWEAVPLGVDEEGRTVALSFSEHNLLVGGEPGAGKSVALSLLVAAAVLDPSVSITLLDGKQVELAPFAQSATRFVGPDVEEATRVLEELREEMDGRYGELLSLKKRKLGRELGFGLHVVAIDELALYTRAGTREQREAFTEALRDLVSRGRAAGMVVLAATQKPSHEVVPTWIRDLFSFRLALRCSTAEASDTILGSGWATQGYSAAAIDSARRGVGWLLHEGGVPVKLKAFYLSDAELDAVAGRAARSRGFG
jgi:DNA segregation ATPase FtsK/SpoIIIE-like protein